MYRIDFSLSCLALRGASGLKSAVSATVTVRLSGLALRGASGLKSTGGGNGAAVGGLALRGASGLK